LSIIDFSVGFLSFDVDVFGRDDKENAQKKKSRKLLEQHLENNIIIWGFVHKIKKEKKERQ
jgi:hypothetical protein